MTTIKYYPKPDFNPSTEELVKKRTQNGDLVEIRYAVVKKENQKTDYSNTEEDLEEEEDLDGENV